MALPFTLSLIKNQNNMSTNTFLAKLNTDDVSKQKVDEIATVIMELATQGHYDTLKTYIQLEFLSQVIEKAKGLIKPSAIDELYRHDKGIATSVITGATIRTKEAGVRYDFSNCPQWEQIKSVEEDVAMRRKKLEEFLKTLQGKVTTLDETTGELVEYFPPIKKSTTTVEVQLPK